MASAQPVVRHASSGRIRVPLWVSAPGKSSSSCTYRYAPNPNEEYRAKRTEQVYRTRRTGPTRWPSAATRLMTYTIGASPIPHSFLSITISYS